MFVVCRLVRLFGVLCFFLLHLTAGSLCFRSMMACLFLLLLFVAVLLFVCWAVLCVLLCCSRVFVCLFVCFRVFVVS